MNESEECNCLECQKIRLEWDSYVPVTNLQRRMKEIVKKIEERERKKMKKRKVHPN